MLKFNVNNQIIARTDAFKVVADSRNYLTARFTFTEEWKGNIVAIFGNGEEYYNVVLSDNTCIVPWEVIKPPFFTVSVFCSEESLVTANIVTVDVEKSGMAEGETPTPPTPDVWQQYIASMQEAVDKGIPYIGENGNWYVWDVDAEIHVDTGIKSAAEDGYTPQIGVDFWTDKDKQEVVGEVLEKMGSGVFATLADITVEEAVNTITIDETSFPDITKVKDFYIALSIEKPETVQSGNLLIIGKTKKTSPRFGVIKTWNHASYVVKGNFYSKYFDNGFRFNSCAETLGANNLMGINLSTTIAQIYDPLQAIIIQCDTTTSLIPAGSKITIGGYVGK